MAAPSDPPPPTTSNNVDNLEKLSWERAWSLDEIRQSGVNWTLAGDAGLLNYLQSFSQKLIAETHSIEKNLSNLVQESKGTKSKLNNAVNDFLNLSNIQFVENRVYEGEVDDVDENEKKAENKGKTKQEKEAELIPKISSALSFGLSVIDAEFVKLEIEKNDSDSEDEEESLTIDNILEAKDPYLYRNLPVLIGSGAFVQDDYVGLQEDVSDDDGSAHHDHSDRKSELDDSDSESLSSISEDEVNENKIGDESWEHADKSNMFDSSDSEDEVVSTDTSDDESVHKAQVNDHKDSVEEQMAPANIDFNAELTKKLGLESQTKRKESRFPDEIKKPRSSTVKSTASQKSKKGRSPSKSKSISRKRENSGRSKSSVVVEEKPDEPDMFAPDEDDDMFSPFSKKGGMFSTGRSLFDESDDDGLFAKEPVKKVEKKVEKKEKKKERSPSKLSQSKSKSTKAEESLFQDDNDDNDLFSSPASRGNSVSTMSRKESKTSSLFNEDATDSIADSSPKNRTSSKKQLPPGAVSMFGGGLGNPLNAALKSRRHGSDSDVNETDEDSKSRIDSDASMVSDAIQKNEPEVTKKSTTKPSVKDDLFADSDDLFNNKVVEKKKPKPQPISKTKSSSLFSDDDDDLFSSKPMRKSEPAKVMPSKEKIIKKEVPKSTGLFDNDEDDDLFSVAAKPKESGTKKQNAGISLFQDDDDLFSSASKKPTKTVIVAENKANISEKKRAATAVSLFDDNDDLDNAEDSLFSAASKPVSAQNKTPVGKSIFDDDDDSFFKDSKLESPEVNLFSEQSPIEHHNKSSESKTPPPKKSQKSLFDGNDDEVDNFMTPDDESRTKSPSFLNEGFESSHEEDKKVVMEESGSFSSPQPTNESEHEIPPKTSPKKLPGAVSLFGGINPFENKKSPLKSPEHSITKPEKRSPDMDAVQEVPDNVQPTQKSPININPAALLPGAKPPLKEHKEGSLSFDEPPEAKTLHNVVKSRAKGKVNRRPPSRKNRQSAARMSAIEIAQPSDFSPPPEVTTKSEPTSPSKTINDTDSYRVSPPALDDFDDKDSYFSSNIPDDIFSPETEEEDMFSVAVEKSDYSNTDDKFSQPNIFSSTKKNIITDPQDDGSDPFVKTVPEVDIKQKSSPKIKDSKKSDVFSNMNDDDLFNVPSKKVSEPSKPKQKLSKDVDDDLFDVGASPAKISSKKGASLFNEDVDVNVKPSKKLSANAQSVKVEPSKKAASLFDDQDDGDIFAGMSSKKTAVGASSKKGLFDDDDIDIFASASKSRSTSTAKNKKKTNKKTLPAQDIFDDPLMGGQK